MAISDVLDEIRADIGFDEYQLTDTNGLRWYNDSRDEVIDLIISKNDEYFYDYITGTTAIGINEYTLPKRGDLAEDLVTTLDGVQKVKGVSIKYKSTDENLTPLRPEYISNLTYDLMWYETNQPISDPFYLLMDNSIFVYPKPTEENERIIYGIMYPQKLTLTDSETLPDQYTKIINYGVKKRAYESQNRQEAIIAKQDFEEGKLKIGQALDERIFIPLESEMPNTTNLK